MTTAAKPPPSDAEKAVRLLHKYDPALAVKLRAELPPLAAEIEALMARFRAKHYTREGVPNDWPNSLTGTFFQDIPATLFGDRQGKGLVILIERRAAIEEDLAGIGEKVPDRPPVEREIFDLLVATDRASEVR